MLQVESSSGRLGCCQSDEKTDYSRRVTIHFARAESLLHHLGISLWLCELIEACQHSMEHPSVHDLRAWQTCMDPRSWCVAAGCYSARYVCSVVRDSRMWCPHDIRRERWAWGEQGTLEMMISPHKVGDEPLTERSPLAGGNGVARGYDDCCC